jgi:two-component system NarL family sensor kinase
VETVVFRVSQEALWNIVRHAGVKTASIELIFSPEEIRLEVSDQGCGFDPSQAFLPPRGFGLAAMRERVEAVGGEFEVISAPGAGARLVAHFPQNVQLGSKTSESLKQAEAKRLAV